MSSIPNCSNDDSGKCCGKCGGIVAVIPVNGRLPLVKHTIQRLLNKNKVTVVICVISNSITYPNTAAMCKKWGAHVIFHDNYPLGAKWNAGFKEAAKFKPTACVFVGSSDWISDNWLPTLMPMLKDFDMVGAPGCHFLDINSSGTMKALYWPGYNNKRRSETIGIGRVLSARILEKIGWKPFDDKLDNSLDYEMNRKVELVGGKIKMYRGKEIKALSISTNKWVNKHKYSDHESGRLPSEEVDVNYLIDNNFPEAKQVFNP